MDHSARPLPEPTPETSHFWEGTRAGELRLQRCDDCGSVYFPPRPFCPKCGGRSVRVVPASGRGRLISYVINHRPHPAWDAPYAIAIVELEEGPHMLTNITHCEQTPVALVIDMPLVVDYVTCSDEITLPMFRPAGAAS